MLEKLKMFSVKLCHRAEVWRLGTDHDSPLHHSEEPHPEMAVFATGWLLLCACWWPNPELLAPYSDFYGNLNVLFCPFAGPRLECFVCYMTEPAR